MDTRLPPDAGSITDAEAQAEDAEPEEYVAFRVGGGDAGRQVLSLDIRTVAPRWPSPSYGWLLFPLVDGEAATAIELHYTFVQVHIRGRNLKPVFAAIKRRRCAVLWEYNPKRWPEPQDKSAPFIESIIIEPLAA